jgi:hypothetical protein
MPPAERAPPWAAEPADKPELAGEPAAGPADPDAGGDGKGAVVIAGGVGGTTVGQPVGVGNGSGNGVTGQAAGVGGSVGSWGAVGRGVRDGSGGRVGSGAAGPAGLAALAVQQAIIRDSETPARPAKARRPRLAVRRLVNETCPTLSLDEPETRNPSLLRFRADPPNPRANEVQRRNRGTPANI